MIPIPLRFFKLPGVVSCGTTSFVRFNQRLTIDQLLRLNSKL